MSKFDDFYNTHVNKAWNKYGQQSVSTYTEWYEPYGGQCVSLIMTYLRYLFPNQVKSSYGNAIDFWTGRSWNGILDLCISVSNAQGGDIVISAGSLPQYGHIWIYKDGQALSQNVLDDPRARMYPISWQGDIYGILRPKTPVTQTVAEPVVKPISKEKDGSVYRLYNASNGDHLYTVDHSEAVACQKAGWKSEGVAWVSPSEGIAVMRLCNPYNGVHHYTTNDSERATLISLGWEGEGVAFYSGGDEPIYRMYNPNSGSHVLTAQTSEHDDLTKAGWKCEDQPMRY